MVFFAGGWRPRRSALFVPAVNRRAIAKAADLACDCLIFDLEDSVAAGEQQAARIALRDIVAAADFGKRERIVRVSAVTDEAFAADVQAARACSPDAILLPKIESAAELARARANLGAAGPPLWAMIESPRAIIDIATIASAGQAAGLACLVVGPNDLARTTGVPMRPGRTAMVPWFMAVVAAARACGMAVLDGVFNNFRDTEGFAVECDQGAGLGFDGKTLIHPSQIDAANRAFGPSAADIERARAIVAAFEAPAARGRGVIQIDGEMIERLHLDMAQRLLESLDFKPGNETA